MSHVSNGLVCVQSIGIERMQFLVCFVYLLDIKLYAYQGESNLKNIDQVEF